METIDLTFDINRSRKIFKKYFAYEWKRVLKKQPIGLLLGLCVVFIGLGSVMDIEFLWSFGIIILILVLAFAGYFYLRYLNAFAKFSKSLEERDIVSEREYSFSFDDKIIRHESKNIKRQLNWELIRAYEINDGDIYLFLEQRQLFEIIALSIVGEEYFEKFKLCLVKKIGKPSK